MRNFLPKKFQFFHDFSLHLHDALVRLIVYGEAEKAFHVRFDCESEELASKLAGLRGEQVFDWLEENGYDDVIGEMLLKLLFPALLSDLCHFVFEALSCSRKGKLTVTYALLRKPLRENLLYLEWLLADPEGFVTTLYNKRPSEMTLHRIGTQEEALKIIQKAVNRTPNSEMYNPEFLYELRFSKAADFGFEQLWNQALHLVTTRRHLETARRNLNFIFSDDESRLAQWDHIYTRLPFLLFYAVDVCEALMTIILTTRMPDSAEVTLHRSLGFVLWGQEMARLDSENHDMDPYPIGLKKLVLDCPRCNRQIPPEERLIRSLYEQEKIKCPHCRRRLSIRDFTAGA